MRMGHWMTKALRMVLTRSVEHKIRVLLNPTVAEGWERNARRFKGGKGEHLGDAWNASEGEKMKIGIPGDQVVPYLDKKVFTPFLGKAEVILEIGPGGGRFTKILLPKCRKLIVADIAPSMLELLKERFRTDSKIQYQVLDGQGLSPLADESIDAAFSYAVFAHLQHWDIFNYLCELRRVLVPGGKAIIELPNTFSKFGWKRFLRELPIQLNVHKQPGTVSLMTPEIVREFTERAGLILEDCLTEVSEDDCFALMRKPETV